MKPKLYLETTIASYLSALPSRDLVTAARQQVTREWWEARRKEFELYVSQIVVEEATAGNTEAAQRRLELLEDVPVLDVTEPVYALAENLVKQVPLPENAGVDALHIAVAVVNGVDYLLTWNCKHIANAVLRSRIEAVCRANGYEPPTICTPEEFLEE
jgi:predicted nucleic acid-binding protein